MSGGPFDFGATTARRGQYAWVVPLRCGCTMMFPHGPRWNGDATIPPLCAMCDAHQDWKWAA